MEKTCEACFLQEVARLGWRSRKRKETFLKERDYLHMFLGKISTNVLRETGFEAKLGGVSLGNEKISLD